MATAPTPTITFPAPASLPAEYLRMPGEERTDTRMEAFYLQKALIKLHAKVATQADRPHRAVPAAIFRQLTDLLTDDSFLDILEVSKNEEGLRTDELLLKAVARNLAKSRAAQVKNEIVTPDIDLCTEQFSAARVHEQTTMATRAGGSMIEQGKRFSKALAHLQARNQSLKNGLCKLREIELILVVGTEAMDALAPKLTQKLEDSVKDIGKGTIRASEGAKSMEVVYHFLNSQIHILCFNLESFVRGETGSIYGSCLSDEPKEWILLDVLRDVFKDAEQAFVTSKVGDFNDAMRLIDWELREVTIKNEIKNRCIILCLAVSARPGAENFEKFNIAHFERRLERVPDLDDDSDDD